MDRPNWESSVRTVAFAVLLASAVALLYKFSDATAEFLLLAAFVYSALTLYISSIWGGSTKRWKTFILVVCLMSFAFFATYVLLLERKYYMDYMNFVKANKNVHEVVRIAKTPTIVSRKRLLQAYQGKRLTGQGKIFAIRYIREVVDLTIDHEFGYLYFRFSRGDWDYCCLSLVHGSLAIAEGTVERITEDRIYFVDSRLIFPLVDETQAIGTNDQMNTN